MRLSSAKRKVLIIAFWLVLWQVLAMAVHNDILIVGPLQTLAALCTLVQTPDFWLSIAATWFRITAGFVLGCALGILLAYVSYRKQAVRELLSPVIAAMKAVPVASFVILILIWAGSEGLSFYISMIVVLPVLYLNTLSGLDSTDKKMLEMAAVFHMPKSAQLRYIYLPQLEAFLLSGFKLSLGMSWKAGVAAEVIGQPLQTVGNGLYRSKINLDTAQLIAWTIVIVLIAWLMEKLVVLLLQRICRAGRRA